MTKNESSSEQSGKRKQSIFKTLFSGLRWFFSRFFWAYGHIKANKDEFGWQTNLAKAWGDGGDEIKGKINRLHNSFMNDAAKKNGIRPLVDIWEPVWVPKGTTAKFDFPDPPHGSPIDCEILSGAGVITYFEAGKFIVGYYLSTEPGETFYIRLNTDPDKRRQKWQVYITGTGEGEKINNSDYPPVNQFAFSIGKFDGSDD